MKILFFGDYSNLHASLAKELKQRGHEVTVISDGGRYMDTEKDILLDRRPGRFNALKYLYDVSRLIPKLKDYDVVQLINTHFLSLRPGKIRRFFDILRQNNRGVFLTLAGNDWHFVDACMNSDMFRFSEFRVGKRLTEFERLLHRGELWVSSENRALAEHIYDAMDGAVSILPEYDMPSRPVLGDRLVFANLPVDLSALRYSPMETDGKVRLFIGMKGGMEIQKGTAMLFDMCRELEACYPDLCEVECVSNLPLKEYLARMRRSHIVLDQYYSYSPGLNGLQAMALGKIAATGGQPEYYRYIGVGSEPIIPLSPLRSIKEWKQSFVELMHDPERMKVMAEESRKLVERCNDIHVVTDKFENHWKSLLK